ncbi:MAG: choice-of-anchor D domain-containing protein [Terriglobales bacterium]
MKRLLVCASTVALFLLADLSSLRQSPPAHVASSPIAQTVTRAALPQPSSNLAALGSPSLNLSARQVPPTAAPLRIELGKPVGAPPVAVAPNATRPGTSPSKIELGTPAPFSIVAAQPAAASASKAIQTELMTLPLRFEPNRGQAEDDSQYIAKSGAYEIHFAPNRADLQMASSAGEATKTISIALENASNNARIAPAVPLPGKSNYLRSSDKKSWITDLPNYAQLQYQGVYPGIDLVFYGNRGRLEYDFIISPHTDPSAISLRLPEDADPTVNGNGDLQLKSAGGEIEFLKPVLYQMSGDAPGQRKHVEGGYRIIADANGSIVRFTVGEYDRSKPLIIDPVLVYSTRANLPGTLESLAVDGPGNVYILSTYSYPTVTKLSPDGSTVVYSTTIGSNYSGSGISIAVDSTGQAHLVSYAGPGYPTTDNCYRPVAGGGTHIAYTVLSQAGDSMAYSTYILGTSTDYPLHVTVDSAGKAYISGFTYSSDFPNTGTATFHGYYDGFVLKMDPTQQGDAGLVYSNLIPAGFTYSSAASVAVDPKQNAYVAINNDSMATTDGAYSYNGNYSYYGGTYVSKYDATGTLVYTAYLGYGEVRDIAVDGSGSAYATGRSDYGDFPATDGAYQTTYPYGYVSKLDPTGSTLVYSTFLSGPSGQVQPESIAVPLGCQSNCAAYVAGSTAASDFPTINAIQDTSGGGTDAFVVTVSGDGSSASFSTYVGGSSSDDAGQSFYVHIPQLRLDNAGNAYIGGNTYSQDFPYSSQTGNYGLYVVKIGSSNGASLIPNTYSVDFGSANIGVPVQQNVILRNYGSATLTLGTPTVTGDFSQSNSCGGSIPPGGSCTMQVTFTATLPAQRYGSVTIPHDGVNSPTQIQLTGYAYDQAYITLTPQQIQFAPQPVNTTSPGQPIIITNTGSQPAIIYGISVNDTTNFAQTNNCPSILDKGGSCTIVATFSPTNVGQYSTPLYVSTNGRYNGNSYVMLYGAGTLGSATAVVSPSSLEFGDQVIGTNNYQLIYVTNTGTVPVTITNTSLTGETTDFSINYNSCPNNQVIYPGNQCSMYIYFSPTAVGARNATVTISSTAAGFPQSVNLSGNGIAAVSGIAFSPASVVFGDQVVDTPSSGQQIIVTNTGTSQLTIDRVYSTSPDFILTSGNCATITLNPLQACSFYVVFRPTTIGALNGSVVLIDSDPTSPQTITLSGNSVASIETLYLTPETLTFNDTVVNTAMTLPVYISNPGNTAITVSSMTVDSPDFTITYNGCTIIYPSYYNYSCQFNVTFQPLTEGTKSATLTIVDSTQQSPHTMALHGTAVTSTEGLIATPQSYTFPDQVIGTTSGYATVSLYNPGTSPVHVSNVATSGDFSDSNYCSVIYPADYCTIYVQFTPTAAGQRNGTLTIFDDAPGNPHTVALSGIGLTSVSTLVVTPSALNFFDQAVGTTSDAQTVYFYNTGNTFVTVDSVTTTTADFSVTYNGCSGGIYPNSYCVVYVTFTPTVAGLRSGALKMTDSATGSPHGANLSGNGLAATKSLTLSPAALDYGNLVVNANASSQNAYLVNSGSEPVTISSIVGSTNVTPAQNCVTILNPGVSCGFSIGFAVTATGTQLGTVTITSDATGSPQTINITATGVISTPPISLSPNGLAFDKQATNTASNSIYISFLNNSGSNVNVSSVTTTGGFSVASNGCNTVVNNSYCSVGIQFTPVTTGVVTGTVTFKHNGPGQTIIGNLTGYGIAASKTAQINPAGLAFVDQVQGTSSNAQYVYEYNVGTLPITVSNVNISSDFAITNSTCTGTISVNSYCYVGVKFQPSGIGSSNGVLTITDDTNTSPHTVSLTGKGVAPSNTLELTSSQLNFTDQPKGTQSPSQTAYLYNTGNTAVHVSSVTLTGADFIITYTSCVGAVSPGSYCYVQVAFTPQSTGVKTSTVTILSDSSSGTQTISLSGNGVAASKSIVVSTDSLQYSDTPVGVTNYANQYFYIYNNGSLPVNFAAPSITGDFSINYNGCSTLQPRSYCYIYIQFTPTQPNTRTGAVQINDDANGNPHSVSLTGYGVAVNKLARLSITAMNFPDQAVGITSQSQYVYLYNQGNVTLNISNISLTSAGDFALGYQSCGTPPTQIAVGSYCYLYFSFTPTTTGTRTGQLTITDDATNSPQVMALSGKGTTANASITAGTSALVFPPQEVSTTSAQQYFYIYNNGNVPITFGQPSIDNPDFVITYNGCSTFNSPGQSCYMYVSFTPSTTGTRNGTVTIPSNAKNSPLTVGLSGTGIPTGSGAQFSQTSVAFGNQVVGTQGAGVTVYYSNQGASNITITNTTIGPSDFIKDSGCDAPRTIGPRSYCAVTLYFKPGSVGNLNGALTITDNMNNSPHNITLSGVGLNAFPLAVLTPSIVSYGNQLVGVPSSAQYVTVSNPGTASLSVTAVNIVPATDYSVASNGCTNPVPAHSYCQIGIIFNPTQTGTRSVTLQVTDNANDSPQSVSLTGSGLAASPIVALSTSIINFAAYAIGTTSPPIGFTLYNTGNATLNITSIVASAEFAQTNNCGSTLDAGNNCVVNVTFTPSGLGTRTGTVTITDDALGSPHQVSLTGTGLNPKGSQVTPGNLIFPNQTVNTTSPGQVVTVLSTGATLTVSSVSIDSGDFAQTNNCNTVLNYGNQCTVTVTFTPTSVGNRRATLIITDDSPTSPHVIQLSGNGLGSPIVSLSSTSLNFNSINKGQTSPPQTVTLTNTGDGPLGIGSIVASGDYQQTNNCSPNLNPNVSCDIIITFTPTTYGTRNGLITINDNAVGNPHQITLTGIGLAPGASVNPSSLTFATQKVGTTSAPQNLTLTNVGTLTLTINSIGSTSSEFPETTNCSTTLAVNASCNISVKFAPVGAGTRTGSIVINTDGGNLSVPLTGTGTGPVATLDQTSLAFGNVNVGTNSATQTVKLTSTGDTALSISSIMTSGDYSQTNNCPPSLAVNASCSIQVTFTPTAPGPRAGTLSVTDNAANSPQQVSLSGTGIGATVTFTPPSLDFSTQFVNTTSTPQAITVSNGGTSDLTISNINTTGDYNQTNNCPSVLRPSDSCTANVTFTPTTAGVRNGLLQVTDNSGTQSASLTGIGITQGLGFNPGSLSFGSVPVKLKSSPQDVKVTAVGNLPVTFTSIVVSGDYTMTHNCPTTLQANGSCTITVTFAPTQQGLREGAVTLMDDAPGSPQTIALSGTGTAPTADLAVTGSVNPKSGPPGTTARYNVVVTNNGPSQATNVALTLTAPTNSSLQSVTPSKGECTGTSTITCSVSALNAGDSFNVVMVATDTTQGPMTTNISVTATESDNNISNNSLVLTCDTSEADIQVLGTSTTTQLDGHTAFTLSLINNGPSKASNVTGTYELDRFGYVDSAPSQGSCGWNGAQLVCNFGTLDVQATASVTIAVQPPDSGWSSIEAHASADQYDQLPLNNRVQINPTQDGYNTRVGNNVSVDTSDPQTGATANLLFTAVTRPGVTKLAAMNGSAPPSGYRSPRANLTYNVDTSAQYNGAVTFTLHFNPAALWHPAEARLFHAEGGVWVDRTTSLNPVGSIAAVTASLSQFAIFEPPNQAPAANAGDSLIVAGTNAMGNVVQLNGTLSSDPENDSLAYKWTGPFPEGNGVVTGPNPTVTLPLGASQVTLVVNDGEVDSPPVAQAVTISDFSVFANVTAISVNRGQSANLSVVLSPKFAAYDRAVTLGCANLPADLTCQFDKQSVNPGANGSTITLTIVAANTTAAAPHSSSPRVFALWTLALGLPFGFVSIAGNRRRRIAWMLLALVLVATLYMVGCGGGGAGSSFQNPPPPTGQTSTINVTGTSSGIQHSIALTVTRN